MSATGTDKDARIEGGESVPLISFERRDQVGTITLRNERRRNALCKQMLEEIVAVLDEAARERLRVVVLRAGPDVKVWSAGHDINELPRDGSDPMRYDDPLEQTLRAIRKHPAPVIAMVHGSVWGLAADLALSCDFVVADRTATFAITAVKLGMPYNATGIQNFINRVGEHIAKQMFFTAEPVDAERALAHGIINYLVDGDDLERYTNDLADRLSTRSPVAISVVKEQIRILSEAHPVSATTFERLEGLRAMAYESADFQEGMSAFFEKRQPAFPGLEPGAPSPADHY